MRKPGHRERTQLCALVDKIQPPLCTRQVNDVASRSHHLLVLGYLELLMSQLTSKHRRAKDGSSLNS